MSVSTISLIATGLFVLVLVAGFLIGLWRGLKKSLLNAVLSIIGAVVAFFVTPFITNAIMGIKVNSNGMLIPLAELLVTMLRQNADIATMMDNNPNVEAFFNKLPYAVGNTIVFIFTTIAIETVIYTIYKIVAAIFMKKQPGEKKHRFGGALVGLGTFFVIVIFAFMPLASLISTADEMMTSTEYTTQTTEADEEAPEAGATTESKGLLEEFLPAQAKTIIKGANSSLFMKVSGLFGMDHVLFDYYANMTVDNQKIYIRQEVVNYYKAADLFYKLSSTEDLKFKDVDYDKVQEILENIEAGGLFKSIAPTFIQNTIVHYQDYEILQSNEIIAQVEDIINAMKANIASKEGEELYNYIKNDIDKTFEAVKTLAQTGFIDEVRDMLGDISPEKVAKLAVSDSIYPGIKDAIADVLDINLVKAALPEVSAKIKSGSNDLVDLDFANWSSELDYARTAVKALTADDAKVDDKSYFELVLKEEEAGIKKILTHITDAQIEAVVKPVLYSQAIAGVKEKLLDIFENTVKNIVNDESVDCSITITDTTFVENASEDQAGEICEVVKAFVNIVRGMDDVSSFNDITTVDKAKLGNLLNKIKENAYRIEIAGYLRDADNNIILDGDSNPVYKLKNEGILNKAFTGLKNKLLSEFSNAGDIIGEQDIWNVDFEALLSVVDTITNAEEGTFAYELAEIILNGEEITGENVDEIVENLIDTIDFENDDAIDAVNDLLDTIEEIGIDVIPEDIQTIIDDNKQDIIDAIDEIENLPDEMKARIFEFLGIEIPQQSEPEE